MNTEQQVKFETKNSTGIFLSLTKGPISETATNLVDEVSGSIHSVQKKRKRGVTKRLRAAVGAIIADLLSIPVDAGEDAYAFRPIGAAAFDGCRIGRKLFVDTVAAMEELKLITIVKGGQWYKSENLHPDATRFYPTKLLYDRAEAYGVYTNNLHFHFGRVKTPINVNNPIELRNRSTKEYGPFGDKIKGKKVWFDKNDPVVHRYAEQIALYNEFISGFDFEGCEVNGFRRIFGNADAGGRDFNQGGRIYALAPSYQNLSKDDRTKIKIDGEETAELDVKCSQLYVYLALRGISFDSNEDGYYIPVIHRDAVKAFMTQVFGSNKLPSRWSSGQRKRYADKRQKSPIVGLKGDLSKDYPIAVVKDAILKKYPVFADWGSDPIKWGQLQLNESIAMVAALDELRRIGVPALPVHDSLIVPASKADVASRALTAMYKRYLGFEPRIN